MSLSENVMDFKNLLQDFLSLREWEDKIEFNEGSEEWYVNTGVSIGEHSGRLIVEGCDSSGILGIYFYFLTKCKDGKIDEMTKLLNWTNCHCFMGNFECLSDASIRWRLKFDCENAALTGFALSQNIQHGWDVAGTYADAIMAVAFTKASAEDAIAEFNEVRSAD